LFDANGTASLDSTTYNLAAAPGWDSFAGVTITTEGVTVSGAPTPPVVVAESMSVAAAGTATGTSGTAGSGALAGDSDPNSAALSVSAVAGGSVGSSVAGTYGHLTLNANGSYSYVADNAAAIASAATGSHPVDTFDYTVSDTDGQSSPATLAFTIDRAPTLSGAATSVGYGSAAITLSPNLLAADPDGANLTGATVVITGGFANDGDILTATTTNTSITASYNSADETLTLSGSDTAADYTAVLDSVTFKSLDYGANNAGANDTRAVTWTVSDGSLCGKPWTPITIHNIPINEKYLGHIVTVASQKSSRLFAHSITSLDSLSVALEREIAESLRPCPRIFPFFPETIRGDWLDHDYRPQHAVEFGSFSATPRKMGDLAAHPWSGWTSAMFIDLNLRR
jgi:VCBS repeat-containing protein